MRRYNTYIKIAVSASVLLFSASCDDLLNEDPENKKFTEETDYTITGNMIQPLIGAYAEFYARGW